MQLNHSFDGLSASTCSDATCENRLRTKANTIAEIGTLSNKPQKPNNWLPIVTAMNTKTPGKPTDCPTIFGCRKFASICWITMTRMINGNNALGSTTAMRIPLSISRIHAPKTGMRLVTICRNATSIALGMPINVKLTKNNVPTSKASNKVPLMYRDVTSFAIVNVDSR